MSDIIVHISEVDVSPNSGMGRIEYHWKEAFEKKGFTFIHIGPKEVGPYAHPALFPYKAYRYFKKLNIKPKAIIAHEPASGFFSNLSIPCFVESHGIEERYFKAQVSGEVPPSDNDVLSLKTKLLFPVWRLYNCNKGLRQSTKLMLSNSEDKAYAKAKFNRKDEDIFIFKNGVNHANITDNQTQLEDFTVLFNASWLERKGVNVLVEAAKKIYQTGLNIKYLLIGTGKTEAQVMNYWPGELKQNVQVVSSFASEDEMLYLNKTSVFVLPSYFEGQPLSLLQAMAAGKCCITTNCCGQRDAVQDGVTGFLFNVGDAGKLAELILQCYNNRDKLKQVGQHAKKYMHELTWQHVSNEVAQFVLSNS